MKWRNPPGWGDYRLTGGSGREPVLSKVWLPSLAKRGWGDFNKALLEKSPSTPLSKGDIFRGLVFAVKRLFAEQGGSTAVDDQVLIVHKTALVTGQEQGGHGDVFVELIPHKAVIFPSARLGAPI